MQAQSLEPSVQEMRQMLATAGERVIGYLSNLGHEIASSPASHVPVAPMAMLPAGGQPLDALLDHLFEEVLPPGVNSAGPGYLGYVPGGGLFQSALADFITKCVNRHAGHESMAPGLVRLEWNVVRWLCDVLKMPETAGGVLTTGGSLSNLMAIVAARVDRLPENFLSGVVYVSDQCHHSVRRAARTAGFPNAQIRRLPTDARFRISLPHLAQAVRADREAGLQPFMVVGSAGTTNTGAVDDLNGLADFARDEGLWLHVDGAYGGFFMLTAEGQRALAGIERADSVALDPHKGLGLPYGTGSLVVRDRALLRRAFGDQEQAGYLPAMQDDEINFCDMSPELSREMRGVRLWLPIQLCGVDAFAANLDEKLQLARQAAQELRQVPGLELIDEPQLSTVVFRLSDRPDAPGDFDAETRELLRRVNHRGSVFLSPTTLNGRIWIRLCVLSFRSHEQHIAVAIRDVRESAAEIIKARSPLAPLAPHRGDSISALFVDVARAHPNAPALLTSKGTVTYRTLLNRASHLAHVLRERGITAERPVGIAITGSADAVVAVLGVLLAGGACVSIDPLDTATRQRQIADDCGTPLILCHNADALDWLPASRRLDLDSLPEPADNAPALPAFAQDRLLYVVYTGTDTITSTRHPQAVRGTHAATLRRLEKSWQAAPFAPGEVVAHLASLNTVDDVVALFSGLLQGVPSAIIDAQEAADPSRLLAALGRYGVTRLNGSSSLLASMLGAAPHLVSALPLLKPITPGPTLVEAHREVRPTVPGDSVQTKSVRELMRPFASSSSPRSRPQIVPASAVDPVVLAQLIAQSFAAREPLAVATAVTADEFLAFAVQVVTACTRSPTRSPLSFVARDADTGAMTGFCMAADLLHVPVIRTASVARSLCPTLALLDELGQAYSTHCGQVSPGEVVELVVTGVLPGQFGYQVASMLEKRTLAAAREMGFLRAVTICTHRVTAQLAQRTGFQRLFAQPYASFEFDQARVFASISAAHGEAAVYERVLVEEAPAAPPRMHVPQQFATASRAAQAMLRSDELCCTR